ncbi:MAG: hypothetical protein U9Q85_00930, partial [Patescibacteria group bacterium]|nr:hypothetical protein [Patescibacteria group bacterium]
MDKINKVIKINLYIFIILIPLFFFYTSIQATISPCNEYTQVQPVPTGFGAAYDVDNPTDLLIKGSCDDTGNSATFTIGDGSSDTYIYNKGYFYRSGAWQEININPNGAISGNWLIGSAQTTINLNTSELDVNNHIVAYTCKRQVDNSWKCGCADSACTNKYWQVQRFKIDSTPPPPVTCSDGTPLNTCSISQPDPYYCNNSGNIVEDCGECGCSNNWNCESDGTCTDPNICIPTLVCTDYPGQCGTGMSDGCDNILDCSTNCSGLEICCNDNCQTTACSNSSACDDFDNCTTDTCQNAGTCTAVCQNTTITTCADGDGCCPSGCDSGNDDDCACTENWTCTIYSACSSGTQTRTCTDSNSCGTINDKPEEERFCLSVIINWPSDREKYNQGDMVWLNTVAFGDVPDYTYKWKSDLAGDFSTEQSPNVDTSSWAIGTHTITVTATDSASQTSSDSIQIDIEPAGTLIANIDTWQTEFVRDPIMPACFAVQANGGTAPYTFVWHSSIEGDFSTEQWPVIDVSSWALGAHIITVTVTDNSAIPLTATDMINIEIVDMSLELFSPMEGNTFYLSENVHFHAVAQGGTQPYNYQWKSDEADISTEAFFQKD